MHSVTAFGDSPSSTLWTANLLSSAFSNVASFFASYFIRSIIGRCCRVVLCFSYPLVCGDDTPLRKPHPDQLLKANEQLHIPSQKNAWYVGDSTTDIIAAKRAGQTAVFFNSALWDLPWLEKISPGTEKFPHKPDVVVNHFSEFLALVLACLSK